MAEIEQIEQESQIQVAIADASELIFKLTARYDESRSAREGMGIKLGYISQKNSTNETTNNPDLQVVHEQSQVRTDNPEADAHLSSLAEPSHTAQRMLRSINPPQASLPKFYGKAEEFAEYWAIFETLVHKNERLDVVEKIILLRESLKGRAKNAIQGIQPLPENYSWMIKTLQQTYSDYSVNRSQIVQKLVNMKAASNFADSCSSSIEQIQVLINQMVVAGYDV